MSTLIFLIFGVVRRVIVTMLPPVLQLPQWVTTL